MLQLPEEATCDPGGVKSTSSDHFYVEIAPSQIDLPYAWLLWGNTRTFASALPFELESGIESG